MSNNNQPNYLVAIQSAEETFKTVESCALDFNKEKYFALQICETNTALQNQNMMHSLAHAVRNVALCGITLNPALKLAYIVPRQGKACLDISYMGLIKIATDSGSVLKVNCQLVYQNDFFEVEHGTNEHLTHKPDPFKDRGAIIGVYCNATLKDGGLLFETMSIDEVYKIRERSKAYTNGNSSPWKTDEGEMIRKTCVKRGSKYWPKTERLAEAISILNEHEGYVDLASPGTEAAEKAKTVELNEDESAVRDDLISQLVISTKTGLQGYAKAWQGLTPEGRKLIGADEHARLKDMAKENTPDAVEVPNE